MSVARMNEIARRFTAVSGRAVHYQAGCENRGNGQTSAYEMHTPHHTATPLANRNLDVLINGRPDLKGPLTNFCTWENGDLGLIAMHPANHAGASGPGARPGPVTSLFNKYSIGNEIIYPGNSPMTAQQYRSAVILARICVDVVGYGDVNRIKAHAETSITGKWDPGYAPGRTIDMNKFRADARAVGQIFVPGSDNDIDEEDIMIVPASPDDFVSIPCNGKTSLFLSTAYGRKVKILGIAAVKDNQGNGQPAYTNIQPGLADINPDQPGPISVGPGCRVVQLRYSADHDFTAYCA